MRWLPNWVFKQRESGSSGLPVDDRTEPTFQDIDFQGTEENPMLDIDYSKFKVVPLPEDYVMDLNALPEQDRRRFLEGEWKTEGEHRPRGSLSKVETINWDDPGACVSNNFTVHEATWLPSWRVYHKPSNLEKVHIVQMAEGMEKIRALFNAPIVVHCWIRPTKANCPGTKWHGKNYNLFIGSTAEDSAHITAEAVDYHVSGFSGSRGCDLARLKIVPYLEKFGLRMEDIPGAGWIHNDKRPVKYSRFYKP